MEDIVETNIKLDDKMSEEIEENSEDVTFPAPAIANPVIPVRLKLNEIAAESPIIPVKPLDFALGNE